MPDVASSTAIVPIDGEYQLSVKDFDAAGKSSEFKVMVPNSITSEQASVMLRAAILKKTTWKSADFPTILHAVMYSDRMGLDIMAGDVYTAQGGRLSTTAGAKIRHAMASGRIEGYEVVMSDATGGVPDAPNVKNMKATVTLYVKGWTKPVVYETTLAEWYMPSNPNWKSRPAYMLRRNALSKAMEEVAPMGVEAEEAPPLEAK